MFCGIQSSIHTQCITRYYIHSGDNRVADQISVKHPVGMEVVDAVQDLIE